MKIVEYSDEYSKKVVRLLKNTFEDISDNDYFSEKFLVWKHKENPHGTSIMFLAIDTNNEVVGIRFYMRWQMVINDIIYKCLRPVDTAISKTYKGKGLFSKLDNFILDYVDREVEFDFIFNTPNENSYPIYIKRGSIDQGGIYFSVVLINPIKSIGVLNGKRRYIDKPKLKALTEDVVKYYDSSYISNGTKVDFDYLLWRYIDNPVVNYMYFKSEDDVIFIFRENKRSVFRELILCDILCNSNKIYNREIKLDISFLSEISKNNYILMTRDVKTLLDIGFLGSLDIPYKKVNCVTKFTAKDVLFSDLMISCRDLELF